MRKIILVVLMLTTRAVFTQQPPAPKAPPVLSDELKAKIYAAEFHMQQAQAAVQAAQEEFRQMGAEFQKACGDQYHPQVDNSGNPSCVLNPPAPAPAPATKAPDKAPAPPKK